MNLRSPVWVVIVPVAIFILYFLAMGNPPLLDPDEPIYGTFIREMLESGDWITPRFHGEIWYDKPPLYQWLAAICGSIVGPGELAWRLPSALMAIGVVGLTLLWGSIELGPKGGALAAIMMGTCLQQIVLARAAVTDMTLVFFLTLTVLSYRLIWRTESRGARLGWAALAGIAAGLGMLTKGPVSLVLPAGGMIVHLALSGRWRSFPLAELGLMLATSLAVGVPWFYYSWKLHPDDFWHDMVMVNHVHRFLRPEHPEQTGHWYSHLLNVPILFVFFFPWSMFLLQGLSDGFKRLRGALRENEGMVLVWGYAATVIAFFSISKTILVTYIFPMYPPTAIIVAAWFKRFLPTEAGGDLDPEPRIGLARGLGAGALVGVLLLLGLVVAAWNKFPEAAYAAPLLGAILVSMFALTRVLWERNRISSRSVPVFLAGGMVLFAMVLALVVLPIAAPRVSAKELLADLPLPERMRVIAWKIDRPSRPFIKVPSLMYYFRGPVTNASDPAILESARNENRPTVVFCKDSQVPSLIASGARLMKSRGGFSLLGLSAVASESRNGVSLEVPAGSQ